MLEKLADWLESIAQPCFYSSFLGVECPGCGMQRAFIELIRGNFRESLILYPALLPGILLIVLLVVHLIFKLQRGALFIKILFIINAFIMVLNYIYKILTP
ncbi:MAG: DUF2752 domain-containing protein [Bacteroidales bacterium]